MNDHNRVRNFAATLIVAAFLLAAGALMIVSSRAGTLPLLQAGPGVGAVTKVLTYVSHGTQTACASPCTLGTFNTSAGTYTHVNVQGLNGAGATLTSLTICGTSGTINTNASFGGAIEFNALATANAVSASCPIIVTTTALLSVGSVYVWQSTGLASAVANSATNSSGICNPCSTNVTALAGGFAIAGGSTGNRSTMTWSNVTQNDTDDLGVGTYRSAGASNTSTSSGTLTCSFVPTTGGTANSVSCAAF